MATFSDLIQSGKIKAAYLKKQTAVADIDRNVQLVKDLDEDSPSVRVFTRIDNSASESLQKLKDALCDLDLLLYEVNPEIKSDEEYIADQKQVRESQFCLFQAIDGYSDILNGAGIKYPPKAIPAKAPADLSEVLQALVRCQNASTASNSAQQVEAAKQHKETIDTLSKHGTQGPKAAQPVFHPKNNDSDYQMFSEFIQKFDNFVLKCKDDVKLQWLQSSVRGDALLLIKHLSATDPNYAQLKSRLV